MLSTEENEALCRVEGQAPMARLMERYWLPAALSSDLEVDGAPLRVKILGRNLVAFRNSEGVVGVLDEYCPHRGASLALARNENCTLQCLYHGWRVAPDGSLVETPTEPPTSTFKERVKANAYSVWEGGSLVWVYLGPPEEEPAKPAFDFTTLPADQIMTIKAVEYCNWLQCLEGALDSAHINWLHSNVARPAWRGTLDDIDAVGELLTTLTTAAPKLEASTTSYGFHYGAIRDVDDDPDAQYIRATEFVMPNHSNFPAASGHWGNQQIFVPMDDGNTMFYFVQYKTDGVAIPGDEIDRMIEFSGVRMRRPGREDLPEGPIPGPDNMWLQDRQGMKDGTTFTGVHGINQEDFVVQESMGPIYDRTREHLGMADVAVIRLRRILIDALRKQDAGEIPTGLAEPVPYGQLRGGEGIIPRTEHWSAVLPSVQNASTSAG